MKVTLIYYTSYIAVTAIQKKKPLLWRNKSQADLQCILGIVCLQIFMQIIFSERFKCRGDVFCLTSSFISCILNTVIIHLL